MELNDVLRFGDYGFSPSGGGKYFALTEEGARRFTAASINRGTRMTITCIEVLEVFLQRGTRFIDPGVQGAGSAIHFADAALPDLYQVSGPPQILDAPWVPDVLSGVVL
jgi:hypothetical protein